MIAMIVASDVFLILSLIAHLSNAMLTIVLNIHSQAVKIVFKDT